MKKCYVPRSFSAGSKSIIDHANIIIEAYAAQGYDLTLRQLYYQFVSRDLIANKQSEYKRLGSIINDARLAGLIDWNAITDRTRNLVSLSHWGTPADIVAACAEQYTQDLWQGQKVRCEVWIEKDALSGVFDRICKEWDVPYFSCRGYTSQSEMWSAAQRHIRVQWGAVGRPCTVVLHFGDHDPSGIDMTRDIEDRLQMFGAPTTIKRLALTMPQIEQYNPPPNPAKDTDARFTGYSQLYGDESWELDALEPAVLSELVRVNIAQHLDMDRFSTERLSQLAGRERLKSVSKYWDEVVEHAEGMAEGEDE